MGDTKSPEQRARTRCAWETTGTRKWKGDGPAEQCQVQAPGAGGGGGGVEPAALRVVGKRGTEPPASTPGSGRPPGSRAAEGKGLGALVLCTSGALPAAAQQDCSLLHLGGGGGEFRCGHVTHFDQLGVGRVQGPLPEEAPTSPQVTPHPSPPTAIITHLPTVTTLPAWAPRQAADGDNGKQVSKPPRSGVCLLPHTTQPAPDRCTPPSVPTTGRSLPGASAAGAPVTVFSPEPCCSKDSCSKRSPILILTPTL